MSDVTPASDEAIRSIRLVARIYGDKQALSLVVRIDAEKARADRAETERDALLEAAKAQVESERGHEHGQIGPDPACYFCEEPWPCPTERLRRTVALILTGEAEADG